jgi:hypothetical protein
MMQVSHAWRVVAERAQSAVQNDDEQCVVCESLAVMAASLALTQELAAAGKLLRALHAREAALREFERLVQAGGKGETK